MKKKLKIGEKIFVQVPVETKSIDKESGTLEAIFSTQEVDRHGDTIIQEGWYLKAFKKNPVIINSHNYYDAAEVIGKASDVKVEKKKLQGKITFAISENPKAKIIFDLYAGGFLHAFSVGLIIKEFAENKDGSTDWYTINEAELLEVSAVSIPANARALAKQKGIDVDSLSDNNENNHDDNNTKNKDNNTDQDDNTDEVPEGDEIQDTDKKETSEEGDGGEDESKESEKDGSDKGDEGGGEAGTGEDESEEVEEEEEKPEPQKTSYKRKVVNAISNIESKEKRQLKKVAKIIDGMLADTGVRRAKSTRDQIRKRKANQVIRMLLKTK